MDANIFTLYPLEGCLIFPFQPHHFTRFEYDEIAWLFISFEMSDHKWLEPLRNRVFSVRDEAIDQLNHMAQYSLSKRESLLPLQLTLLLNRLLYSNPHPVTETQPTNTKSVSHKNLSAVLKYIQQNLNSPLNVEEVIAQSGYSETILRELFEKYLNTSIAAYIRKMRILQSCHLLATSTETIGAISDLCGFSSQYSFSRTFKQVIGCPPSTYRNSKLSR